MSKGQVTWMYAVASDLDQAVPAGLVGSWGEQVRGVSDGSLTAVVGSVQAEAATEQALEQRLSDPTDLDVMARSHHRVIEAVAERCPVLPLRLATVYRNDDRVLELLRERGPEFAATLRWLAGRSECGVKVWAAEPAVRGSRGEEPSGSLADGAAVSPAASDGQRPGAAYLLRRKAQREARRDAEERLAEQVLSIHDALSGRAVAARQYPVHPAGQSANDDVMVLNGSYLVEQARVEEFAESAYEAVRSHAGLHMALTGPWPAYSFAAGPEG